MKTVLSSLSRQHLLFYKKKKKKKIKFHLLPVSSVKKKNQIPHLPLKGIKSESNGNHIIIFLEKNIFSNFL